MHIIFPQFFPLKYIFINIILGSKFGGQKIKYIILDFSIYVAKMLSQVITHLVKDDSQKRENRENIRS